MMPFINTFIRELDLEIERQKPTRRGRRSVDPDHLLTEIAAAYAGVLLEMPLSTQGGVFYNVAAEILAVVQKAKKDRKGDVQRWVLAAVANVRALVGDEIR